MDGRMKKLLIIICLLFLPVLGFSAEIFSSNVDSATTAADVFDDVNCYDGGAATVSTTYAHSGTKSIRLAYPNDEAGCELKPAPFSSTTSLYTRKYEYFDSNWSGNWPIGLKTSRYFTRSDYSTQEEPNAYAYMSEKFVWQTYEGSCSDTYGRGLCMAIYNLDLEDTYGAGELFGNGYPYIRTGHWYKLETWMVLNSATDVSDGILRLWVDDVQVYNNTAVMWKSTARGVPNGTGWLSMWYGGNYSGATCGNPSTTLYRYIDDMYLSTTLDRDVGDTTAPVVTADDTTKTISTNSYTAEGDATDAVGVTGCTWKIGAGSPTACTGTTSWSCATSGYTSGANTLTVSCSDASANTGSDTVAVTYTPETPAESTGCRILIN